MKFCPAPPPPVPVNERAGDPLDSLFPTWGDFVQYRVGRLVMLTPAFVAATIFVLWFMNAVTLMVVLFIITAAGNVSDRGVGQTRWYPLAGTWNGPQRQPSWRRSLYGRGFPMSGSCTWRNGRLRFKPSSYWELNGATDWEFTPVDRAVRGRWVALRDAQGEVLVVRGKSVAQLTAELPLVVTPDA